MPRPSRKMDERLIRAAGPLVLRHGFSGLKVRTLARRAGVNLGMFHYHFKTKREFTHRALGVFYERFFKLFSLESGGTDSPLERLRRALNLLGRFSRDHRLHLLALLQDSFSGNRPVLDFARANLPRHVGIILDLVRECQRRGLLQEAPLPFALTYLIGAVGMPNAVLGILEKTGTEKPFGVRMKEVRSLVVSDEAIARRVDMALKGLARRPERGKRKK